MKKKTDEEMKEDRIKSIVDMMTSENPSAPSEDKEAKGLEEKFGLGNSGDRNQFVQDQNEADDEDPYGDEDEDGNKAPRKLMSSKDVLKSKSPKLFRGGRDVMTIIIGSHK